MSRGLGLHAELRPVAPMLSACARQHLERARSRPVQVLPWTEQLAFCLRHWLPVNDTWLLVGDVAQRARAVLDELAVSGSTTAEAVAQLDQLASGSALTLRVPGTYPHAEWQGTRIEGFVVSQGDEVSETYAAQLAASARELEARVVHIASVAPELRRCVEERLEPPADADLLTPDGRARFAQHATQVVAGVDPDLAALQVCAGVVATSAQLCGKRRGGRLRV